LYPDQMHIDPVRARAIPGEGNSERRQFRAKATAGEGIPGGATERADPSEGTCRTDRPGERLWMQQMQQMQR
jgi:hypothetical protein